jgi:hypothetical protein
MLSNLTRYIVIILLSSGVHTFSTEQLGSGVRELQTIYNKYDEISQLHITVPSNLSSLYDFHKNHMLDEYRGYYTGKEPSEFEISEYFYPDFLYFDDPQGYDKEIYSTLKYASSPDLKSDFDITPHSNPGHSGAEIYILNRCNMKIPKIAKVFKGQSVQDLRLGFLEFLYSLLALSLNPDPSKIRMTRIFSAGYAHFSDSKEPHVFCILFEMAPGESIKEQLRQRFIDHPNLFNEVLKNTAQFMEYFHVNSYEEFTKVRKVATAVKHAEIKDREAFCRRRISILSQDVGFTTIEKSFFNFQTALSNIEKIFAKDVHHCDLNATVRSRLQQHFTDTLDKFKSWIIPLEDRVITHGDMHIGNLCYLNGLGNLILHQFTLIDFSSIKRTYGAIGDPAQDVGKFIASIWKEIAIYFAQSYGDQFIMENWYKILCVWQETFITAYIESYTQAKCELKKKSSTHTSSSSISGEASENSGTDIMTVFRERVYFYKLCLYAQFFDDPLQEIKAKQFMLYFLLRESGLLDQVIAGNLGSRDTELKMKDEQLPSEKPYKYPSSSLDPSLLASFSIKRIAGHGYPEMEIGHGEYHPASKSLMFQPGLATENRLWIDQHH